MSKGTPLNITGQRFGRLTVIERAPSVRPGRSRWLCLCDCGNKKSILLDTLRAGRARSCGCLQRESRFKAAGEAAFNNVWNKYQVDARHKKLRFCLTVSEFRELTASNCYYCGNPPATVQQTPGGSFIYNGIDRQLNSLGYFVGNVVPCCITCNIMKGQLPHDMFIRYCMKIASHHAR